MVFAQSGKFDRIYCVDPWDRGQYTGRELPERSKFYLDIDMGAVEYAFDITTAAHQVIVKMKMTSEKAAGEIGLIDMVYIDAIHEYEFVKRDISLWQGKVKHGGWICGHDYCKHKFSGVVRAVDEAFGKPMVYEDDSWAVRNQ